MCVYKVENKHLNLRTIKQKIIVIIIVLIVILTIITIFFIIPYYRKCIIENLKYLLIAQMQINVNKSF